jgi:hypothetical protein
MKDTKELSQVQVLREATIADLASEIGTARSVSGSGFGHSSGLIQVTHFGRLATHIYRRSRVS